MDRETFRQKTLEGDDRIRNTRLIWNHLDSEQKAMFLAGYKAIQDNDGVTNAFLDKLVSNFNSQQGERNEVPEPTDADLAFLCIDRATYYRVAGYLLGPIAKRPERS